MAGSFRRSTVSSNARLFSALAAVSISGAFGSNESDITNLIKRGLRVAARQSHKGR